ncbi:MAG: NADAR domain-containing protein [Aristaeellaceae bacterium]
MQERIVVMGGFFNPPTLAHQRLMLEALGALEADRGIYVPAPDAYAAAAAQRAPQPGETLPEPLRLSMLRAMAADDPRLTADDLAYHRQDGEYPFGAMQELQRRHPGAALYYLDGDDSADALLCQSRVSEFLEQFHIIVIRRDGEDPAAAIGSDGLLRLRRDRLHGITAPDGLERVSSSAVLDMLRTGDPRGKGMVHPAAWPLLRERGLAIEPVIRSFQGEYRFLSNFWDVPIAFRGLTYQNAEAAFQAQKCLTEEEKLPFTALSPGKAKHLGRRVRLRPDWEDVKLAIMEEIVRAKFTQNEELKQRLLATGDLRLEEGNAWRDTYWGVDIRTRRGRNHLGEILMRVRRELREA